MIHHVGITVHDLAASTEFYRDLLGGSVEGPFERSGPRIDEVTGYPGVIVRQSFVSAGYGDTVVELLQYENGSPTRIDPDHGQTGAAHVAITVDDLDATLERLRGRGVAAVSEPIVTSHPMAGCRAVYVLDPDRVRVELVQLPA
ncbi:VOC family protein [Amycolatopsis halotolerans]|uniref:VOC family protein n=1 Tax=Amycolatopsis halotolerans TaxID=330083 RepID=A0ABV7Q9K4_9PSEU